MFFYQILKSFTEKEKKLAIISLSIFLLSSILWIANFINTNTVAVPAESSNYTEGVIGQPKFINPVIANSDIDRDLSRILYSSLADLMDHYTIADDGKTWDVFLKSDLLWSDNSPLTSDDVVFTVETIQDSEARSPLFTTWQGIIVNRISELEIEFNLRNPYAFFPDNLNELKIIPKHIFGNIPAANLKLSGYNLEPVGSGPYKYSNYSLRKDGFITQYTFTINPEYSGKKPFIKNISINFYQGQDELINAFNSRKIDGFGNLNPINADKIKISHKITELKMPRYYAIFINQNTNEALKDINVRNALNISIDKNKLINDIFNGKAEIVNQPITSTIDGFDSQVGVVNFSTENASELLEKNGWKLNPDTAIREKKVGKNIIKLELQLIVPQIQFLTDTAEKIKTDWEKIGVKLEIIKLNPSDITEDVIKSRNYQMLLFGNILRNNPDIFSFWHSSEKFYPGLNLSLYQNKEVDDLIESIRKEVDPEKRKISVQKLQTTITSDTPALFLFSPYYLYVSNKNFGGLDGKVLITPSDRFNNINEWYLQTSRALK